MPLPAYMIFKAFVEDPDTWQLIYEDYVATSPRSAIEVITKKAGEFYAVVPTSEVTMIRTSIPTVQVIVLDEVSPVGILDETPAEE